MLDWVWGSRYALGWARIFPSTEFLKKTTAIVRSAYLHGSYGAVRKPEIGLTKAAADSGSSLITLGSVPRVAQQT